jgi:hypothetical protein
LIGSTLTARVPPQVSMLRRVQHMSVVDRLEVAVLLAVNSQRAWSAMLGPDARPLLTLAGGSETRRLLSQTK